jgi:hypothetical protein
VERNRINSTIPLWFDNVIYLFPRNYTRKIVTV